MVSEDPAFRFGLRREAAGLESVWMPVHSARECLVAIEDPRVRIVVLDGAVRGTPAGQLLRLIKKIRPQLAIVFAFDSPDDAWEREAREAGVVYYGDRSDLADMVAVIRRSLPESPATRPSPQG